ncbi:hypothetical protein BTN49_2580 [Candidatus Enterovibrio escicola]|uniref:Uncharacterized protein n=1 Tax=Candidatus Enterovibrio escicola TaxID=1927127 RepID=A0A2A5T0R0_9GAMM|nr:hypothetical protein BTN49_2580 [Candidatus Enterovibrio escacola]
MYRRFNFWSKKGISVKFSKELSKIADFEWIFIEDLIVRTHQLGTGITTQH